MSLPLTRIQAHEMAHWIKSNFSAQIIVALKGTPFTLDIACAIACQETGVYLLGFSKRMEINKALSLCVFDASGDAPGTKRSVFPKNTNEFRSKFGDTFTKMLIDEANKQRLERGLQPAQYVYKGYGIFQYDLQHVEEDRDFFENRHWYEFDTCLKKLRDVLMDKHGRTQDVMKAIRSYNGSGPRAESYLQNVKTFIRYCSEVNV